MTILPYPPFGNIRFRHSICSTNSTHEGETICTWLSFKVLKWCVMVYTGQLTNITILNDWKTYNYMFEVAT